MLTAPLVGLAVDRFGLWPVGMYGSFFAAATLLFLHQWRSLKSS
jgi:hypothetical protein